jgi:Flp pilus assembly pilin Flp
MKKFIVRFIREEEGQDVIEYALLGAFISVVAGTLIVSVGTDVVTMFTTISGALPPG